MKGSNTKVSFVDTILNLMEERKVSIMDAVLYINESQGIEIEKLASLIKSSPKLKALINQEASALHMLK